MKIFLSHSSKDKSIVRDIRRYFSDLIQTWIDEKELIIGQGLEVQLEQAVKRECDLVVLFLSDNSASSEWVEKEMRWACEAEKNENRTILIPVLIDDIKNEKLEQFLHDRVYIKCVSQEIDNIKSVAGKIENSVVKNAFNLIKSLRNKGVLSSLCINKCDNGVKLELSRLLPHHSKEVQKKLIQLQGERGTYIDSCYLDETKMAEIVRACIRHQSSTVGHGNKKTELPFCIYLSDLEKMDVESRYKMVNTMANRIKIKWESDGFIPIKIAISKTESIKLSQSVANLLNRDVVYVEPYNEIPNRTIEGDLSSGDHVYYIHDVIVSGSTVSKCISSLRRAGASVDSVFAYVKYDSEGIGDAEYASNDVEIHALLNIDKSFIHQML